MAKSGTWKKDDKGWWYQYSDGTYPKSKFEKIDKEWYYFNSSGYAVKGWQKIGKKWYYFDSQMRMVTGWKRMTWNKSLSKFYFGSDGAMYANGTYTIKKKKYKFDKNGRLLDSSGKNAILEKPSMKMKSVAVPTRNGNELQCSFKPKDKADDDRSDRATHLHCLWRVYSRDKGVSGGKYSFKNFGEKDDVKITETSDTYVIGNKSDKFDPYPANGNHIIERIDFMVCLKNKLGLGPYTTKTFDILDPEKPTISNYVATNGVVFTVKQNHPANGNRPCTRTEWYMEWGNDNKNNSGFNHKTGTNTATQFNVTFTKDDIQDLNGKLTFVRLKARGQGWGGDGEWSDWSTHYLFDPLPVDNFTGFGANGKAPYYKISGNRLSILFEPPTTSYTLDDPVLPAQAGTAWAKVGSSYTKAVKAEKAAKKKASKKTKSGKNTKKTTAKKNKKK